MKFVSPLTASQVSGLQERRKSSLTHRQRQRAHAVLLSAKGYTLDQLQDILDTDRDSISGWLGLWHEQGLTCLSDAPKPGRPYKLDAAALQQIAEAAQRPQPNLRAVLLPQLKKGDWK